MNWSYGTVDFVSFRLPCLPCSPVCFLRLRSQAFNSSFLIPNSSFFQRSTWDSYPASPLSTSLPRKEVIQPHLPIRLPCYDFTPVIGLTFGS